MPENEIYVVVLYVCVCVCVCEVAEFSLLGWEEHMQHNVSGLSFQLMHLTRCL